MTPIPPQPARRHTPPNRSHRSQAASWAAALFVASVVVAALGLAGCGKKGDPLPPVRYMPARTTQLQAVQRGDALLLSFPYPKTTPAGTALDGISRVDLVSMTFPASIAEDEVRIPNPPQVQFDRAAATETVLELGDLATAVQGDQVRFRVPLPARTVTEGREAWSLGVRTLAKDGELSDLSDLVTVELREPPEPPRDVVAEPGPDGVRISWDYPRREDVVDGDTETSEDAADEDVEGEGEGEADDESEEMEGDDWIVGFHVYRRPASARTYGDPIARPRARFRQFEDDTARVGERYIYTVTAVSTRRPMVVESAPSAEIEVDYRDFFAPAPPEGLVALPEETAAGLSIRLVWEPSESDDLAGYRVYRRLPGETEATRLGDLIPRPELTDANLPTEGTVVYRVSAVDQAGNESGASEEVSVRLR